MEQKNQRKLSSTYFNYSLLFSIILIGVLGLFFIFSEVYDFKKQASKIRAESLKEKKLQVKNEVNKIVDYIEFSRSMLEAEMKDAIQQRVYEAWSVMDNLYRKYKGRKDTEEIKSIIKEALRNIRFNNGRGYYFIVSLDGVEELYPIHPEFEGKNLINLQDEKGNYVIKDELRTVKTKGEGFVTDYWKKPGSRGDMVYAKTSFVKIYKPLNWYVGTGEYLDNARKEMQEDVIDRIKQISFGQEGYVFVNTYDGVAVVIDSDKYSPGDTVWNVTDAYGVKVIQEEREAVENPEGDYIHYHWKKKNSSEIAPKISFIKGVEKWQWMIGAGVYTDEIESEINQNKQKLYGRLLRDVFLLIAVLAISVVVVYFMVRYLSAKISANFSLFTDKLVKAVRSGSIIRKDEFSIAEILRILEPVNQAIINKVVAEKQLQASEIRYRTIFENAPVMFIVLDDEMNYKLSNRAIQNHINFVKGQPVSKTAILKYFTNKEINKRFFRYLKEFDGKFRETEVRLDTGVKIQNWAAFKTSTHEIIFVGYDITDLRMQQRALKATNKTKDKVMSIISHDMNGPFNNIIGFSRLLWNNFNQLPLEKKKRYLLHIYRSSQGLHAMLQNLLSWARAQSGSIKINADQVNIHQLVDEALKVLKPIAESKDILVKNNIETKTRLNTDAALLRIVIQNFIANSIKFTKPEGHIQIYSCDQKKGELCIIIKDNGIGMSNEEAKAIMQGIEIKSRKGTQNESGTGLGMLICRDFIHSLGGNFHIDSEEGKGTMISIRLPNLKS